VEGQKKIREMWKNQVCDSEIKIVKFEIKLPRITFEPK
jgi:hypothetical protein